MASASAVVIPAASLVVELVAAENGVLVAAVVALAVAPAVSIVVVPVAAESGVLVAIPVVIQSVATTAPGEYLDVSAVLPAAVPALVVLLYVKLGDLHLVALDSSFSFEG